MLVQLSEFWLDRHHSDVEIEILAPCGDCTVTVDDQQHTLSGYARCGVDSSDLCPGRLDWTPDSLQSTRYHVLARVPGHRVLLSAASTYFAALLSLTWTEGVPSTKKIQVVVSDAEDATAVVALLKCIYYGEVGVTAGDLAQVLVCKQTSAAAGAQPFSTTSAGEAAAEQPNCSCKADLASLTCQASLDALCWQELVVRVIRLADQLSVPGVMKAAAGKLSCLFSYQLSWPAVLAVLWLPAALAQQPLLQELRQMAINRVTQDMKHLDPCLASSLGRSVLQHLPPDALATLLSSDQLALVSENSTLAAIDVWLAGPVASSLSLTQGQGCDASDHTAARDYSRHDEKQQQQQHVQQQQELCEDMVGLSPTVAAEIASQPGQRLAEALQLLLRQVRLPLCSGAFLAAAVCQRPWLCVGLRGSHELNLMKQYYGRDSQGRYDLAMKLLRSGASCPWSVALRRGLPSTFIAHTSSIHSNSGSSTTNSSKTFTHTGLSQIKAILLSKPVLVSADAADGGGSCSSLDSSSRSSSFSLESEVLLSISSSCHSDESVLSKSLQQAATKQQLQPVKLSTGTTAMGLVIDDKVLGGYLWQMALVAVPTSTSNSVSDIGTSSSSRSCGSSAACCGHGCSTGAGGDAAAAVVKQQLCLSVSCRPAWADELDPGSPHYEAAAVHQATQGSIAAAAAGEATVGGQQNAACGAVLRPAPAGATEAAAAAAADHDSTSVASLDRCITCDALWTIAGAKAAEAIARHAPMRSIHQQSLAAACSCRCNSNHLPQNVSVAAMAAQNFATERLEAAESVDCKVDTGMSNSSCSQLMNPSASVVAGPSSLKLAHLDVVVGVQLTVCSNEEQLHQLVGERPGNITNSNQGSHVPCLLEYHAASGTAQGVFPVNVTAINTGQNVLQRRGEGETGASSRALEGWQPELWSMFAPTGSLHWHVSLRALMD